VLSQIENQKYDVILMIHPLYKAVARAGRKQKAPAYTIPNRLPGKFNMVSSLVKSFSGRKLPLEIQEIPLCYMLY
jgi:hypothetical protein